MATTGSTPPNTVEKLEVDGKLQKKIRKDK
jgi:hypothetical protein